MDTTTEGLRRRRALQEYVRSLYTQPARLRDLGALCGLETAPRYDVLTTPEPCECCGTMVVLLQRDDRPGPIWYQVSRIKRIEGGFDVTFQRHDAELCGA